MSEATFKTLLRCKLEFAHAMIELLPETIQSPIRSREKEFLSTIQEVVKEFIEETPINGTTPKQEKALKTIEIN